MKYLVGAARWIVGILFVFSGLIKLNDPVGFSFKLEEYFSPAVLDLDFLTPYALAISLFVVILEVLLGVMLLVGFRVKFTVWSLLLMIIFFTFLTFYSAYYNKVTDCGCFGDAIKLTPWESFTKDIILLVLIVFLFVKKDLISAVATYKVRSLVCLLALVASVIYANYVLNHLPVVDFRPYKLGANLEDGMNVPDDAPKPIYEYAWKFNVDGQEKIVVTQGEYPSVEGEFIGVETTEIQEGYEPPIHDFTIEQGGQDFAANMLQEDRLVMVIAYDLAKSDLHAFTEVREMAKEAKSAGYKVIGMSASDEEQAATVRKKYGLDFEFYFTDQTTLKTIIRSNPGILVLHKGTVVQKKHHNDIDELTFKK
ncbi:BT_3928 family protein [Zeaxanthinibacter enoshimensis]|uniref:BT_3928 family protein n=1 Tax=Zeaxanthinibacter enoshimensis TaxID=392009 RepID=UPI00356545AF